MPRHWCRSVFVLQSVKETCRAAIIITKKKKEMRRLKSFLFLGFVSRRTLPTVAPPLPPTLFFFSFHASLYLSISSFLLPHQGKKKCSLCRLEYQMPDGLKYATNRRGFCICCEQFVFLFIKIVPWQAEDKRGGFILFFSHGICLYIVCEGESAPSTQFWSLTTTLRQCCC